MLLNLEYGNEYVTFASSIAQLHELFKRAKDMKINALIERTENGYYSIACNADAKIGRFCLGGFGSSVEEAKADFAAIVKEAQDCYVKTMHVSSVGIPTVEQSRELKVYPNPTRGNVFIQNENAIIERVVVTDLYGRTVATIPVNDYQGTLDLSSMPNGLYLLRIEQVDGTHIMHKIIKE